MGDKYRIGVGSSNGFYTRNSHFINFLPLFTRASDVSNHPFAALELFIPMLVSFIVSARIMSACAISFFVRSNNNEMRCEIFLIWIRSTRNDENRTHFTSFLLFINGENLFTGASERDLICQNKMVCRFCFLFYFYSIFFIHKFIFFASHLQQLISDFRHSFLCGLRNGTASQEMNIKFTSARTKCRLRCHGTHHSNGSTLCRVLRDTAQSNWLTRDRIYVFYL